MTGGLKDLLASRRVTLSFKNKIRFARIMKKSGQTMKEDDDQTALDRTISERNGFTLAESLCGLCCAGICMLLCTMILQTSSSMVSQSDTSQEQMAILQLRSMASLPEEVRVDRGRLVWTLREEQISVSLHKNRLVKRPGYQILMEDLERGIFKEKDGQIILVYETSGKTREAVIR